MEPEHDSPRTIRGVHIACYILLAAVFVYVGMERYHRPRTFEGRPPIELDKIGQLETRIDPNTATWPEFARLPEVGESLARQIVAYRNERLARARTLPPATAPIVIFRSLKDLDPVPGLGEKTLQQMESYLRFP